MADYQQEYRWEFGDTTYRKVFVGGLAWETPTEKMRAYFEQFGEILEAVVICDKHTGKSKGYGFVTYKEAAAASRACENPNPFIDGRKANCNIASFGRPTGRNRRGTAQGQASASSSSSSSYSGMPTPQQDALPSPYFYHPYGYPPCTAYYQGIYNPQFQQSQYYAAGVQFSPSSSLGLGSPYYYGYPMTAGFSSYSNLAAHRTLGPSYSYPTQQMEARAPISPYPNPNTPPAFSSASDPSLTASSLTTTTKQNQVLPSTSKGEEAEAPQSTSTETDAVVIPSKEDPSST